MLQREGIWACEWRRACLFFQCVLSLCTFVSTLDVHFSFEMLMMCAITSVSTFSVYFQCLLSVSTFCIYFQCLLSVSTFSVYFQCLLAVSTLTVYFLLLLLHHWPLRRPPSQIVLWRSGLGPCEVPTLKRLCTLRLVCLLQASHSNMAYICQQSLHLKSLPKY